MHTTASSRLYCAWERMLASTIVFHCKFPRQRARVTLSLHPTACVVSIFSRQEHSCKASSVRAGNYNSSQDGARLKWLGRAAYPRSTFLSDLLSAPFLLFVPKCPSCRMLRYRVFHQNSNSLDHLAPTSYVSYNAGSLAMGLPHLYSTPHVQHSI